MSPIDLLVLLLFASMVLFVGFRVVDALHEDRDELPEEPQRLDVQNHVDDPDESQRGTF